MPPGCRWASVRAFVEEKDPGSPRTPVVSRSRRPRPSGARRRPRTGGGGRWGEPALYARPGRFPEGAGTGGGPGAGQRPRRGPEGRGTGSPAGTPSRAGRPWGSGRRPTEAAAGPRSPESVPCPVPESAPAGGRGRVGPPLPLCAPRGLCRTAIGKG